MTIEINPTFAVGPPVPECQLTCQNSGYCTYISTDASTLLQLFASGGMIEHCVCPPGYTGLACEKIAEQCHDLKCHNGTPCSLMDGQYFCDCSEADAVSTFAGDMCREPATSYCGQGDLQNRGFCTNGGLCKTNLIAQSGGLIENEYSTHNGCHCPPEFEGPHCEYLKGMTPITFEESYLKVSHATPTVDDFKVETVMTPITSAKGNESMTPQNSSIFASVAIFLGIAMSIFGVAFLAKHQRRSRRNTLVLDRESYKDETPIRVRIMGELESIELELGDDGHVDDEDLHSISECSLEEIELEGNDVAANYREYLQNIRDGGFETYFEAEPDFTDIIGPLANEERS